MPAAAEGNRAAAEGIQAAAAAPFAVTSHTQTLATR
jgi:hypothetical protein